MSRLVVVTGAAGAIGTALRQCFTAQGDRVIGIDLTVPETGDTADPGPANPGPANLGSSNPNHSSAALIQCDVSDPEAVARAFAGIRAGCGDPGVLVNNAAITGAGGISEESPADWQRIIDVNLTGAYLCAREVIAGMRAGGGGKICNIASVNARFGGSALSGPAYAASKGGLVTLSRFLAREHASDNIQVNAVAPGPHDTPMWSALDPTQREGILETVPGTAPGSVADLAAVVCFLCGPHCGYITGATIDVNGGQWMG